MKKNINHWILLLLVLFFNAQMQAQIGTGLLLEDEAYNTTPQISQVFAGSKFSELPLKTSLKEYCPKVTNQGEIGSCVGWSSGYGAFTIMRAKEEGWTDKEKITKNAYSALYIYNQVKIGDCYQGSLFSSALKLLKKQGDCLSSQFDYPMDDCNRKPSSSVKALAQESEYEVKDYFTLFRSTEDQKQKIRQTKISLSQGKPVIIGMMIRENFKDLTKAERYWSPSSGNTSSAGGHAMVVIGYNDGKGAFEVMNSWGTEWGTDGFFWIKYEDFGKYCVYGYQLMVGKKFDDNDPFGPDEGVINSGKGKDLAAEFVFRYPDGYDDEEERVIFQEAEAKFNGDYYVLIDDGWEENQRFQLVTRKITKDRYVYVFSVDPENRSMIHWPRNQAYNEKFSDLNENAIVPYNDVEIIVPGEDRALIKDKVGKDNLIVLYSTKPIDDFAARVYDVRQAEGNYQSRLEEAFGKRLIDQDNIKYNTDRMDFSANTGKGGYIVPIVLLVETK